MVECFSDTILASACLLFVETGKGVKVLYEVNNHHQLNKELLLRLERGAKFVLKCFFYPFCR